MALLPLKHLVLHAMGDRVASLLSEAAGILMWRCTTMDMFIV